MNDDKRPTDHSGRIDDLEIRTTIGRHLAVADLPVGKFKEYIAWLLWSVVHLLAIVGVRNRLFTFLNWIWRYFTYD